MENKSEIVTLPPTEKIVPVETPLEAYQSYNRLTDMYYDSDWELIDAKAELERSPLFQKVKSLETSKEMAKRGMDFKLSVIELYMINNSVHSLELEGATLKLKCTKSSLCHVTDENRVPEEYTRTKVEVDKKKALADLRQGMYIEGLELRNTENYKLEVKAKELVPRIGGNNNE